MAATKGKRSQSLRLKQSERGDELSFHLSCFNYCGSHSCCENCSNQKAIGGNIFVPREGHAEDESRKKCDRQQWNWLFEGGKERIFPLQYRIIQSHTTPMQHIVVLQYMYLILCLNISTSVSYNSSFFCSGKNWDTNSGAKGITCFILSTDLPHTPNLVHTASNIGGKKLL